jgi:hypothetical protein
MFTKFLSRGLRATLLAIVLTVSAVSMAQASVPAPGLGSGLTLKDQEPCPRMSVQVGNGKGALCVRGARRAGRPKGAPRPAAPGRNPGVARTSSLGYGETVSPLGCTRWFVFSGQWYYFCSWYHHFPITPSASYTEFRFYRWTGTRTVLHIRYTCLSSGTCVAV